MSSTVVSIGATRCRRSRASRIAGEWPTKPASGWVVSPWKVSRLRALSRLDAALTLDVLVDWQPASKRVTNARAALRSVPKVLEATSAHQTAQRRHDSILVA